LKLLFDPPDVVTTTAAGPGAPMTCAVSENRALLPALKELVSAHVTVPFVEPTGGSAEPLLDEQFQPEGAEK
jgi:hypothetical protein